MKTLADIRNAAIKDQITSAISIFLHGDRQRHCAWCGRKFTPRSRYHFFDTPFCRKYWYKGVFQPKKRS